MDRMLDDLLSVDAVGRFKPDPAAYQLACEASGVEPARIGFVTANGWDAAGAASLRAPCRLASERPLRPLFPRVGASPPLIATWESLHDLLLVSS